MVFVSASLTRIICCSVMAESWYGGAIGGPRGSRRKPAAADPSGAGLSAPPLLPQPTAAALVKSARAYLLEPTRPVTPAEACTRHLLHSSCSYTHRPTTSASCVASHEFVSAAAADGMPWRVVGNTSSCAGGHHADVWTAEEEQPCGQEESWTASPALRTAAAGGSSLGTSLLLPPLPGVQRTPVSAPAPAQSPLPSVSRSCSVQGRAASAGAAQGGKLSTLAPLRPATAAEHGCMAGGIAAAADVAAAAAERLSRPCSEQSDSLLAARQCSSSGSESSLGSSSAVRPSSTGNISSRGSSSCGSNRSRLGSRGSEKDVQQDAQAAAAAEAELEQLVLCADAAVDGEESCAAAIDPLDAHREWQHGVVHSLERIQALSLSPADAPALLRHCAELQCRLDTAADWGVLQQWLAQPAAAAASIPGTQSDAQCHPGTSSGINSSTGSSQHADAAGLQGSLQQTVLQVLVRLVDSKKPDVLVKVGAMLLSTAPPGSHVLLPAAKMLYSLSKDSSNDSRFRHHGVLRPLLRITTALSTANAHRQPQQPQQGTALLYCSGCLKNLSTDTTNQKSLGRLGGVSTMAQVLMDQASAVQSVAAAQQQQQQGQRSRHPQHEAAAQVAVQATAVLRNLAVVAANSVYFTQQHGAAVWAVISLLQPFQQDPEVVLNASRCLSKLSMYADCRLEMLQGGPCHSQGSHAGHTGSSHRGGSSTNRPAGCTLDGCCSSGGGSSMEALGSHNTQPVAVAHIMRSLLHVSASQPKQWPAGIRLAFALGQLTTYHAGSRPFVAAVPGALDGLLGLLLGVVQHSMSHEQSCQAQQQQSSQAAAQQPALAVDFMTKLLRLLANLGTDRTLGPALAAKQGTADALVAVLRDYQYEEHEELVLHATAALTNLAYYDTPSNKVLQMDAEVLLMSLLPLLTSGQEEAMAEAARAAGNLARASPAVRAALMLCQQQQHQQLPADGEDTESSMHPVSSSSSPDHHAGASDELTSSTCERHISAGPYVLQSLVLLLEHGSWHVVHSAAGALINLAALPEAGTALSRAGLAAALTAALHNVFDAWHTAAGDEEEGEQQQQQLGMGQRPDEEMCTHAAELLLQSVGNMVAASAAAVSEAILGAGGARCAELCCSSEDLGHFSKVIGRFVGGGGGGGVLASIQHTAQEVQLRLTTLWGM